MSRCMDGDIVNVPKAQMFFITGQVRNGGPLRARARHDRPAGDRDGRRAHRARIAIDASTATRLVSGKNTDVSVTLEDKVQPNDTITIRNRFF